MCHESSTAFSLKSSGPSKLQLTSAAGSVSQALLEAHKVRTLPHCYSCMTHFCTNCCALTAACSSWKCKALRAGWSTTSESKTVALKVCVYGFFLLLINPFRLSLFICSKAAWQLIYALLKWPPQSQWLLCINYRLQLGHAGWSILPAVLQLHSVACTTLTSVGQAPSLLSSLHAVKMGGVHSLRGSRNSREVADHITKEWPFTAHPFYSNRAAE